MDLPRNVVIAYIDFILDNNISNYDTLLGNKNIKYNQQFVDEINNIRHTRLYDTAVNLLIDLNTNRPMRKSKIMRSITDLPSIDFIYKYDYFIEGKTQIILKSHTDTISCVATLPDGRIVSGTDDNTLIIWEPKGKELILSGHNDFIVSILVFPDGKRIASLTDGDIKIWDTQSGDCLVTIEMGYDFLSAMAILNDDLIVSGSHDNTLKIWDARTDELQSTLEGHTSSIRSIAVLPDKIVSLTDENIKMWDFQGKCILTLQGDEKHGEVLKVLPNGMFVTSVYTDIVKIWDPVPNGRNFILRGHTDEIVCLIILKDGRIVTGSKDTTLRVWNYNKPGKKVLILTGHTKIVTDVRELPNGYIVSGSIDSTLRIWNPNTGECKLIIDTTKVMYLDVSSDGKIVSGSGLTLTVWE